VALKSGHLAYLRVPPLIVRGAERFLDSVESPGGRRFGETSKTNGTRATTAAGLLCRIYLGAKLNEPEIQKGIKRIQRWGPSGDPLYNFFAMQLLFQNRSDACYKSRSEVREKLFAEQATEGHNLGSWLTEPEKRRTDRRYGRLYQTAMGAWIAGMREPHLPIYGSDEDIEFEL